MRLGSDQAWVASNWRLRFRYCLGVAISLVAFGATSTAAASRVSPQEGSLSLGGGVLNDVQWSTGAWRGAGRAAGQRPCLAIGVVVPSLVPGLGWGTEGIECIRIRPTRPAMSTIQFPPEGESPGMTVGIAAFEQNVHSAIIRYSDGVSLERKAVSLTPGRARRVHIRPFRYVNIAVVGCPTWIEGMNQEGIVVSRGGLGPCPPD